jgi:hypothetical protein
MNHTKLVSREHFIKRLIDLCLRSGLAEFPKDRSAQQILFKSMVLMINTPNPLTEKEINEKLSSWINHVCPIENLDHITVRRMLIDAGYITRSNDGSRYQLSLIDPMPKF